MIQVMFANRALQLSFFFAVFGIVAVLGFFIFRPYLNTLVLAATFAIVFYPLYSRILESFRGKLPSLAAALTVLVASVIIFVPAILLGTEIFQQAREVYGRLSTAQQTEQPPLPLPEPGTSPIVLEIREKLDGLITEITANIDRFAQESFGWVLSNAGDFSRKLGEFAIKFFIWFLAFYYFLRDGHRIRKIFVALSPLSDRYDQEIAERVRGSVKSVVGGSLIVALLQGIAAGIGFWIFGVPAPALWGMVAVLAALVPTIGTALVMLPAVGYLFLLGNTAASIGLLIWGLTVVNLIDNLLRPKLIERGTRTHPLLILLSVLGGVALLGPVGFLIGPIVVSLLMEFLEIYNEMILQHRHEALPQHNPNA